MKKEKKMNESHELYHYFLLYKFQNENVKINFIPITIIHDCDNLLIFLTDESNVLNDGLNWYMVNK